MCFIKVKLCSIIVHMCSIMVHRSTKGSDVLYKGTVVLYKGTDKCTPYIRVQLLSIRVQPCSNSCSICRGISVVHL